MKRLDKITSDQIRLDLLDVDKLEVIAVDNLILTTIRVQNASVIEPLLV